MRGCVGTLVAATAAALAVAVGVGAGAAIVMEQWGAFGLIMLGYTAALWIIFWLCWLERRLRR